jgi:hypothetical protein
VASVVRIILFFGPRKKSPDVIFDVPEKECNAQCHGSDYLYEVAAASGINVK